MKETSSSSSGDAFEPEDQEQRELLARYVDAFERYDMEALTSLIHEDAIQSMPVSYTHLTLPTIYSV